MINGLYKEIAYYVHELFIWIDPRIEMSRCYHKVFGRWPNFKNPKTLVEKVYWLQLHTDTSLWTLCADKYKVREYLERKQLSEYLNELYGVWDTPDEINFASLPVKYVLKTNNGCSQTIFSNGDIPLDISCVKKKLKWWNNHRFGVSGGELHYINIPRKIIAEKLLPIPKGESSLIDYKIWCFSGEPYCVFVTYGRQKGTFKIALYDLQWNPMFQYLKTTNRAIFEPTVVIPKPKCLDEMLWLARKLSEGFPEVRIDLYDVEDRPVFGEMTFSTGFGYFTDDFYQILGDKVELPDCSK